MLYLIQEEEQNKKTNIKGKNKMEIKVYKNSNESVAQVFNKGVMISVQLLCGEYVMSKGNRVYGGQFSAVPKTLVKLYEEMVKEIKAA